jgi:carboxylesterase type B
VFVFDNPFPLGLRLFSANDQQMADTFRAYWSNFATHLSPNGAATAVSANANATFSASAPPVWPQYQTATDQNIVLEVRPGSRPRQ